MSTTSAADSLTSLKLTTIEKTLSQPVTATESERSTETVMTKQSIRTSTLVFKTEEKIQTKQSTTLLPTISTNDKTITVEPLTLTHETKIATMPVTTNGLQKSTEAEITNQSTRPTQHTTTANKISTQLNTIMLKTNSATGEQVNNQHIQPQRHQLLNQLQLLNK